MTIPTAIHAKRIVGTALAYNPVPSCYSKDNCEPKRYQTCSICEGTGEDEDGDECWKCDGDGRLEIAKPRTKPTPKSKSIKTQTGIRW